MTFLGVVSSSKVALSAPSSNTPSALASTYTILGPAATQIHFQRTPAYYYFTDAEYKVCMVPTQTKFISHLFVVSQSFYIFDGQCASYTPFAIVWAERIDGTMTHVAHIRH